MHLTLILDNTSAMGFLILQHMAYQNQLQYHALKCKFLYECYLCMSVSRTSYLQRERKHISYECHLMPLFVISYLNLGLVFLNQIPPRSIFSYIKMTAVYLSYLPLQFSSGDECKIWLWSNLQSTLKVLHIVWIIIFKIIVTRGVLELIGISKSAFELMACISNHIHIKQKHLNTDPCPSFNNSLAKVSLELGHGWVIKQPKNHKWHLLILS